MTLLSPSFISVSNSGPISEQLYKHPSFFNLFIVKISSDSCSSSRVRFYEHQESGNLQWCLYTEYVSRTFFLAGNQGSLGKKSECSFSLQYWFHWEVKSVPGFNPPLLASKKEQLMAVWQAQDQEATLLSCAGTGRAFSLVILRNKPVYLKALAVLVAGCVEAPLAQECHYSENWHVLGSERQLCCSNPSSQLGLKSRIPWMGWEDSCCHAVSARR